MKITKWITQKELEDTLKGYNRKWSEYSYVPIYEELPDSKVLDAIDILVKEIADKGYVICGDTHQLLAIPIFDDNKYLMLSQRRWGEVMADAANLHEHSKDYKYLDFYLAHYCNLKENLPKVSNK